jgi:hypothetical protein
MSPSVMTLPTRNFKFLTRDQLKEQEIIDVATKIAIDQEAGIGVQVLIRKRTRRRIDGGGPRISRSRAVGAWPGTRNGDHRAREANRRQGHLPSSSLFGWALTPSGSPSVSFFCVRGCRSYPSTALHARQFPDGYIPNDNCPAVSISPCAFITGYSTSNSESPADLDRFCRCG